MLTKNCSLWIAEKESWDDKSALPQAVIDELYFWARNLDSIICVPLVHDSLPKQFLIYSDASSTGCGARVFNHADLDMVHLWNEAEKQLSSTWRELKAIELLLKLHGDKFKSANIKWYTDNQGVPVIIHKGSMKNDLHLSSLEIFELCLKNQIRLTVDWIPREINEEADALSKVTDTDDWQIDNRIFNYVNKLHGAFSIDLFASNLSHETKRFYSKYWCLGSEGVDAFAYNWGDENCWAVPPPYLVPRFLDHIEKCKGKGVLVVPGWQSASFWPLLNNGTKWTPGLQLIQEYSNPTNFFIKGPFGNDVLQLAGLPAMC
jgi:hypothetical protein